MKVLIAGATGALGTQLVPRLVARGHESLSPEQRAALLLHDVFDYGYDEIAGIIGESAWARQGPGSAGSRWCRSRSTGSRARSCATATAAWSP